MFNNYFDNKQYMKFNANMQRYQSGLQEKVLSTVYENNVNKSVEEKDVNNNQENINIKNSEKNKLEQKVWKIEIPKIGLDAQIAEGTNPEILNEYVGHFSETPNEIGNVALAAHNRGYKVNYFERLKELTIGDKIYYTINNKTKIYQINLITIIKDTEWKNLENTEDNRITLITCVENDPNHRRCFQGIEVNN